MRLLESERNDILKLLSTFQLIDQVRFVKKKGWIHIQLGPDSFTFHRKKESRLIDNQFKDKIRYFIRKDHQTVELPDWSDVRTELDKWLKQINR